MAISSGVRSYLPTKSYRDSFYTVLQKAFIEIQEQAVLESKEVKVCDVRKGVKSLILNFNQKSLQNPAFLNF
jgi:hypothetical protein